MIDPSVVTFTSFTLLSAIAPVALEPEQGCMTQRSFEGKMSSKFYICVLSKFIEFEKTISSYDHLN